MCGVLGVSASAASRLLRGMPRDWEPDVEQLVDDLWAFYREETQHESGVVI
jgi:hypothetical protein